MDPLTVLVQITTDPRRDVGASGTWHHLTGVYFYNSFKYTALRWAYSYFLFNLEKNRIQLVLNIILGPIWARHPAFVRESPKLFTFPAICYRKLVIHDNWPWGLMIREQRWDLVCNKVHIGRTSISLSPGNRTKRWPVHPFYGLCGG